MWIHLPDTNTKDPQSKFRRKRCGGSGTCNEPVDRVLEASDRQTRMDLPEERKLDDSALKECVADIAKDILSKYGRRFPQRFKRGLELGLFRGYSCLRDNKRLGKCEEYSRFRSFFTKEELQREDYKKLASMALDHYNNERGKRLWVLEELITIGFCNGLSGHDYFFYFGARKISTNDLCPFYANIFLVPDKSDSEVVKCVKPLRFRKTRKRREVDQICSSCDDSIIRKTRKITYMKQGDSRVISFSR